MSLKSNPFYVLGATPNDDRRRIMALANDRRLDGDEAAVREARTILITPRKRLAAEIAWLPGMKEDEIRQVLALMDKHPDAGLRVIRLPALARANLMADGLVGADPTTVQPLAKWIVGLAIAHDHIRADEVTTAVNEARLEAGVPMASQQDVVEELRGRRNHFRDVMERCMDGLAFSRMVEVVTSVVNLATQEGARHASPLIDNLVDSYYERKVREKMAASRLEIGKLVSQVRERVGGNVAGIVAQIERAVRGWDVMAQPTQVSLASRGMSHPASDEIMREVRNLAIELFNEHGLLQVTQSLTKTLREVFAEMEPITEVLDKDVSALDGIADKWNALAAHASRSVHAGGTRTAQTAASTDSSPRGGLGCSVVLLGTFAVLLIGVIIIGNAVNNDSSHPRSNDPAPSGGMSRSVPAPRNAPESTGDPSSSTRVIYYYTMPRTGTSDVYNLGEIRWCLRQRIRIETWRPLATTRRQIVLFNQVVDDYNGRCSEGQNLQESMTTAQRDVRSRRVEIITEARRLLPWRRQSVQSEVERPRVHAPRSNSNSGNNANSNPPVPRPSLGSKARIIVESASARRWLKIGRGSNTVAFPLPAGTYAVSTSVVGNRGIARIQARQLTHGPFWLSGFGDTIHGPEKKFSLSSPEVLEVGVRVSGNAEWTIRIEKIANRKEY